LLDSVTRELRDTLSADIGASYTVLPVVSCPFFGEFARVRFVL